MKVQLGHIVQNLFDASTLDEVPVSRLQELAETHPYFGAGHLLLSQKLKHQQSEDFEAQVQRTALYFHDPLWLHWQLAQHEREVATAESMATMIPVIEPKPDKTETSDEEIDELFEPDSIEPPPQPNPEADPAPPPPVEDEPTSEPVELPGPDKQEEAPVTDPPIKAEADTQIEAEASEPQFQSERTEPQFQAGATEITEYETPTAEIEIQPEVSNPEVSNPGIETPIESQITEPGTSNAETEIQTAPPEPQTTDHKPQTPDSKPAFEPYHTIDYFASQGIKVSNEVQPTDRLGKQLKSFTEWLKTMKRLPQTAPDQNPEPAEQDIRRIAATSLQEKEVVTETMAEVLVKQDKRDEAIAIYKKLSLLDPSKSAYFAAKIENLKEN